MTDLLELLKAAGLPASGYKQWATHAAPGSFTPAGVMIHHTAAVGGAIVEICYSGRSGLPGPLCNIVARKDGTLVVVSDGKANDSGQGSSVVLREVRNDRAPAGDAAARGLQDDMSGNAWFYDIEIENKGDGLDPYPIAQQRNVTLACAAICAANGWPAARVIGHKEWTRRKIDPRALDMPTFRDAVASRLAGDTDMDATQNQLLIDLHAQMSEDKGKIEHVKQKVETIEATVNALKAGGAAIDYAKLAKAVNDDLAARLKA